MTNFGDQIELAMQFSLVFFYFTRACFNHSALNVVATLEQELTLFKPHFNTEGRSYPD